MVDQDNFPGHRIEIAQVTSHQSRSLASWALIDAAGQPVIPPSPSPLAGEVR
jgi:hypothetical protein